MGQSKPGSLNSFYGKKHSPEALKKMRLAKLGKVGPTKGKNWKIADTSNMGKQKGELHWNWKGGITSDDNLERKRFRRTLQMRILARDNYTCQVCGQYSGYLQVDHIKSWAENPDLRFVMDNCRTLCMACHYYVTFKRKLPQGVVWGHNLKRGIVS